MARAVVARVAVARVAAATGWAVVARARAARHTATYDGHARRKSARIPVGGGNGCAAEGRTLHEEGESVAVGEPTCEPSRAEAAPIAVVVKQVRMRFSGTRAPAARVSTAGVARLCQEVRPDVLVGVYGSGTGASSGVGRWSGARGEGGQSYRKTGRRCARLLQRSQKRPRHSNNPRLGRAGISISISKKGTRPAHRPRWAMGRR